MNYDILPKTSDSILPGLGFFKDETSLSEALSSASSLMRLGARSKEASSVLHHRGSFKHCFGDF